VIRPIDQIPSDADIDRQVHDGREDAFYAHPEGVRPVFDYSRDGVVRSIEESLERLGLQRIDVALIHDPDDHWRAAIGEAYPALHRLREEGTIGAIGAGMNQSAMLARFAREGDFDVFMLAGRYTLFDQDALAELLPLCVERRIAVLVAGVMNSGLLAGVQPGAHLDYRPAPPSAVERARRLEAVCARHGVSLKGAAIQFPLAHPTVAALVAGVRSVGHFEDYPALMRETIPPALWVDLKHEALIATDAPTPG
jgi:D-threo-aldose 1-dehydrogenase